jgi:hypothetical protein
MVTSGNMIVHGDESLQRTWNENRDYLYAIPINERLLSNGALTQNPGWNDGLKILNSIDCPGNKSSVGQLV